MFIRIQRKINGNENQSILVENSYQYFGRDLENSTVGLVGQLKFGYTAWSDGQLKNDINDFYSISVLLH